MKFNRNAFSLAILFAFVGVFFAAPQDVDARKIRDGQKGLFGRCEWVVSRGSFDTCVAYKYCKGVLKTRLPKPGGAPGYTNDNGNSCVFSNGVVIEDGQLEEDFHEVEEVEVELDDNIAMCIE